MTLCQDGGEPGGRGMSAVRSVHGVGFVERFQSLALLAEGSSDQQ